MSDVSNWIKVYLNKNEIISLKHTSKYIHKGLMSIQSPILGPNCIWFDGIY